MKKVILIIAVLSAFSCATQQKEVSQYGGLEKTYPFYRCLSGSGAVVLGNSQSDVVCKFKGNHYFIEREYEELK